MHAHTEQNIYLSIVKCPGRLKCCKWKLNRLDFSHEEVRSHVLDVKTPEQHFFTPATLWLSDRGLWHWPVGRAQAILVQISFDPNHHNEGEGHLLWEVTYMSHWDTCCLYKVSEMISLRSLVHSQCIFKVLFQGVEEFRGVNIILHLLQASKYSISLDTYQVSPR